MAISFLRPPLITVHVVYVFCASNSGNAWLCSSRLEEYPAIRRTVFTLSLKDCMPSAEGQDSFQIIFLEYYRLICWFLRIFRILV